MIDLLVQVHAKKRIWLDLTVRPPHIPVSSSFIFLDNPAQLFRNLLDNGILCVRDVYDDFLSLWLVTQFGNGDVFGAVVSIDFV